MGIEDKVKEGVEKGKAAVERGKEGVQKGTGVSNFGARFKHFFGEIVPDVIYGGEMILENVIYTAVEGHMPPPDIELGMIAGTKVLNDYIVGELWWKNRKEKLKGGQVFKNYWKGDLFPDLIETGLVTGAAYLGMQSPLIYDQAAASSFAEGAKEVAVWGGELGAAALGAEVVTSFGIPVVGWVWGLGDKLFKWYDRKITGRKYNAPTGTSRGTPS